MCDFVFFALLFFFFFIIYVFLLFLLFKKPRSKSSEDLFLSVEDIDLITPLLNEKLNSIGHSQGFGASFSSDYWSLMLKLKRIRLSLSSKEDY